MGLLKDTGVLQSILKPGGLQGDGGWISNIFKPKVEFDPGYGGDWTYPDWSDSGDYSGDWTYDDYGEWA